VATDTVAGLQHLVGGDRTFEIEAYGFDDAEIERVRRLPGVSRLVSEEFGPRERLTLRVRPRGPDAGALASALAGHADLDIRERRTTMEDVYLDLVQEEAA
jgi:hypothetical protein